MAGSSTRALLGWRTALLSLLAFAALGLWASTGYAWSAYAGPGTLAANQAYSSSSAGWGSNQMRTTAGYASRIYGYKPGIGYIYESGKQHGYLFMGATNYLLKGGPYAHTEWCHNWGAAHGGACEVE